MISNALAALTPTHWISLAALTASLVSLYFSARGYLRDRPKLKIRAVRYRSDETPGYIEVKAVNAGRRPIFLIMLWGKDSTGCGSGIHFDYEARVSSLVSTSSRPSELPTCREAKMSILRTALTTTTTRSTSKGC